MASENELRDSLKECSKLLDDIQDEWLKFGVLSSSGTALIFKIDVLLARVRKVLR